MKLTSLALKYLLVLVMVDASACNAASASLAAASASFAAAAATAWAASLAAAALVLGVFISTWSVELPLSFLAFFLPGLALFFFAPFPAQKKVL